MNTSTNTDEMELAKKEKKKNIIRKGAIVVSVLAVYAILAVVHYTFFDDSIVPLADVVGESTILGMDTHLLTEETTSDESNENLPEETTPDEPNDNLTDETYSEEDYDDPPEEAYPEEPEEPEEILLSEEPPEFVHTSFSTRHNRIIITIGEEQIYQADFQPFALLHEIEPAINQLATTLLVLEAAERNDITFTTEQETILLREVSIYRDWFDSIDATWDIEDERAMQLLGAVRLVNPLMDIYISDAMSAYMSQEERLNHFFNEIVSSWREDANIVVNIHGVGHFLEVPHQH